VKTAPHGTAAARFGGPAALQADPLVQSRHWLPHSQRDNHEFQIKSHNPLCLFIIRSCCVEGIKNTDLLEIMKPPSTNFPSHRQFAPVINLIPQNFTSTASNK